MASEDKAHLDRGAIEAVRDLSREAKAIETSTYTLGDGSVIPLGALHKGLTGYTPLDLKAEADKWRTQPERRTGTAKAGTLGSFIQLVLRHKDASSAVFADIMSPSPSLLAVVDYHEVDHTPRFGKHRVSYAFPLSPEWLAWRKVAGEPLSQTAFAEWMEDHIHELAEPTDDERALYEEMIGAKFGTPADVLKLARGISIHVDSKVSSVVVLSSGEGQISFEEAHEAKGSDGKPLKVPGLIMLRIPLFFGGAEVRIPLRLRYRKGGSSIVWSMLLFRAENFVHDALLDDVGRVEQETGLPVYEGSPEA